MQLSVGRENNSEPIDQLDEGDINISQAEKFSPQKEAKPNDRVSHLGSWILGVKITYTTCSSLETTAKRKSSKRLRNIKFFCCEF